MDLKTVFVIAVTTSRMIMPGMPDMSNIPGMKMPDLNAPKRELKMNLTSDKAVDKSSKAQCAIPSGLKLGPKVDLVINLPVKTSGSVVPADEPGEKEESQKFVMKFYWQCAEVVPDGQPRIIDSGKMMSAAGSMDNPQMKQMMKKYQDMSTVPNWSYAYWPGEGNPIKDESQHCPGSYTLTTNYCGGTDITLDKAQDFLAPIELVSPGKGKIDLQKTIKVDWKPVPNALAYILTAFGGKENEMVMWTSAGDPNVTVDFANTAMSAADVKKYIDKGILLPPDKTSCRIPAGVFEGYEAPMLMVTAVGADKFQEKDKIATNVVVRSSASMLLASGMGMDEEEFAGDDDSAEVEELSAEQNDSSEAEELAAEQDDSAEGDDNPKAEQTKKKNPLKKLKDIFKYVN